MGKTISFYCRTAFLLLTLILTTIFSISFAGICTAQTYSLRLKLFSHMEFENMKKLHDELKDKGYLVYYKAENIQNLDFIVLYTGCFNSIEEAEKSTADLSGYKNRQSLITESGLIVNKYKNRFEVITSPSSIWYRSKGSVRELYPMRWRGINVPSEYQNCNVQISNNGKKIAFYSDKSIMKADLNSGDVEVLKRKPYLMNCSPKWSEDGEYIAYVDNNDEESRPDLWVMKSDGSEDIPLTFYKKNKKLKAVHFFEWHPKKQILFFVEGNAFGNPDTGGNLFSLTIDGQNKVIQAEDDPKNKELMNREFKFNKNELIYTISKWDKNFTKKVNTTEKKININKIKYKIENPE